MNENWIDSNMLINTLHTNEFGLPALTRGNVRIEWSNLGEGYDGEYDSENPEDDNLLRFDVSRLEGETWEPINDGSYCTQVKASESHAMLTQHLKDFMDTIYDDVSVHGRAKRLCEQLSWTS